MGTKFTVFDNGLNPDRALRDMSNARQELAAIFYVSTLRSELIYSQNDKNLNTNHKSYLFISVTLNFSGD